MSRGDITPCPFCLGYAELCVGEHGFDDVKIRCTGCEAEGPLFTDGLERSDNEEAAVTHWNTRPQTTARKQEIAG